LAGVVDRKNLLNIVVDTLIVFGTVNALVGISQFFGFDPLGFTSGYGTEAFGFMGNPDFLARNGDHNLSHIRKATERSW